MANKIILKKSSVVGRVPTTSDLEYGELALNYSDGKLYYKTANNAISSLGGSTNLTQIDRQSYTATAGQTTFNVIYGVPYVDVYVNGVHLSNEDYTANNGNTVVLTEACSAGDQVDVVGYSGGIISAAAKANGDLLVYNSSTQIWENFPQSSVTVGNASKWATARTLSFTGDATGSMSVDGSANVSAALTLANSGVTAGSYGTASAVPVITVDAKGRVTSLTTTAVAGVSSVSYDSATGVLTIGTSSGTTYTPDLGVGSSDSPTFAALTTTGNLTVGGNLTVNGTTTTLNTATLSVDDLNITVADGAADSAAANGAGLTVAGANATITYTSADDRWNLNKNLNVSTVYGALSGNASTATTLQTGRNINGVSFNGSADVTVTTAGTGITVTGTTVAIDSTVVTLTGTQTLTNKTLTSPVISTIVNTGTLTLPTSTDTLVGRATTDTLSNKSLNAYDQKTGSTTIANNAVIQTVVATTTQSVADSFSASTYRSAKYIVQVSQLSQGGTITGVAITQATNPSGQFTCDPTTLSVGDLVTISGTPGAGYIQYYTSPTTYKVSAVVGTSPNVTGFTLTTVDGTALTTSYGSTPNLTYTILPSSGYQSSEIMILHNGTTTSTAEYAMMNTNGILATFSSDINGGNVRLLVTMGSAASATINICRTTIVV